MMSLDLSFFPFRTEVLEGEYGLEPVPDRAGRGKERGRGPDVLALPDFPASLCSLRMEMERVQQEQSKVRQDLGQAGMAEEGGSVEKILTSPCCPLCLP